MLQRTDKTAVIPALAIRITVECFYQNGEARVSQGDPSNFAPEGLVPQWPFSRVRVHRQGDNWVESIHNGEGLGVVLKETMMNGRDCSGSTADLLLLRLQSPRPSPRNLQQPGSCQIHIPQQDGRL